MQRVLPLAVPLVSLVLAVAGCNERRSDPAEAPAPAPQPSSEAPAAEAPRITFEKIVHDFGRITDTRKQTALFRFTNTGTGTLRIQDMKSSCGCTVPQLARKEFPPGDGDVVSVTFDPQGRPGVTDKTIDVVSNSRPNGVIKLQIKALVETMLRCDRFLPMGDLKLGQEYKEVIRLEYDDPNLVLRHVVPNRPYLSARITEMGQAVSKPGGKTAYAGTIEVTLSADAPWGIIQATRVRLTAYGRPDAESDPIDFTYTVYLRGGIWGDLRTVSNLVGFSQVKPNERFEKFASFKRGSGAPFTVTEVSVTECDMPGVEARVEAVSPAEYRLAIHGTPGTHRGGFRGVVTVRTNVPGEEVITFPFSGIVK